MFFYVSVGPAIIAATCLVYVIAGFSRMFIRLWRKYRSPIQLEI